ncbi:ATP synthase subunit E [Syncephalastrum racemosum]|uniref:ATP synthase F(0) complex subunit e, mitochondrial n=1 Tax=Syncephalastrum racemosum TaxID=13706 RepID=A0A1X2H9C1_SYNRA|nr:ATP synthase subunit E [Syncephalastrum racemosum]
MVNKAFVNVGRWSALAFGVVYGVTHNASLQKQEEQKKLQLEYERKEHLIEQARQAYAKKSTAKAVADESNVVVDVDSPDFDLEKYIAQLELSDKI